MKKLVEKHLGYEISEKQYDFSKSRALEKLESIIRRFGNEEGLREKTDYLAQLIAEDVKANLLSQVCIFATVNVLNMEKEHSANAGAPFVTGHIVAQEH